MASCMAKKLLRTTLLSLALLGTALAVPACSDETEPTGLDAAVDLSVAHDLSGGDLSKNVDAGGTD